MGDEDRTGIPLVAGTAGGLFAWVIGYLVTYVATVDRIENHRAAEFLDTVTNGADGWKLVGWLFYNAHAVDIQMPQISILSPQSYNVIATDDGLLWALYLLPPLLLTLMGVLVVWGSRCSVRSASHGAVAGATVAVGYVLATIGGLIAFAVSVENGVIRPDPTTAVLLAGAIYPMVFGAIGGTVAGATTRLVLGPITQHQQA